MEGLLIGLKIRPYHRKMAEHTKKRGRGDIAKTHNVGFASQPHPVTMTILTADQIHTDDFDPLLTDDPALVYKEYDELRSRCPVARTSKYNGYWSLLNYADVKKAANSSDLFISSVKAVVPSDPKGIRRPPLNTDGDVHTPYRRALDRTLKPARLRRLQQRLVFHAEMEFMKLVNRGGGDVCCDFGSLYVAKVETEWLNLEAAQGDLLAQTASKWVAAWRDLDATSVSYYSNIMYGIARDVIAERRINPRDAEEDPASSLLEETGPNGEPLDEEQLVGAIRQSLVVGTVAPPIILGSIVRHLSQHRGLQQQLREDPSLLPAATEEFIRLFSPCEFDQQVAHTFTNISDQIAGFRVLLLTMSSCTDA